MVPLINPTSATVHRQGMVYIYNLLSITTFEPPTKFMRFQLDLCQTVSSYIDISIGLAIALKARGCACFHLSVNP